MKYQRTGVDVDVKTSSSKVRIVLPVHLTVNVNVQLSVQCFAIKQQSRLFYDENSEGRLISCCWLVLQHLFSDLLHYLNGCQICFCI